MIGVLVCLEVFGFGFEFILYVVGLFLECRWCDGYFYVKLIVNLCVWNG